MNTEEMQKVSKLVRTVLIVLAVFLAIEALGAFKSLRDVSPAYNSISITGEGEAVAVPDIATFSFSISADAKDVSTAQEQVTEKMNALLDDLKTLGIEDRDIKTLDYSVYPKYSSATTICSPTYCPPSRSVQDGYTVTHSVLIKIRKTEDAGKALSLVGEKGATGLSGITFTVDDPDQITDEARAEAIEDAQKKAKILSKELGVKLVRIVSFYDNTGGVMPYYAEGMGGDVMKSAIAPVPNIPAGENKVNVSVTIVYEIR